MASSRSRMVSIGFGLMALFMLVFPGTSYGLNCQEVRQLVGSYLKTHFSYQDFDDELSRRTLDNFIKFLDPGKVYFLKSDVADFEKKYATKLDDMITSANCKAIEDITNVYMKRFEERIPTIAKAIDSPHNFKLDEYMTIDRKKMDFAETQAEINERWRQQVKFRLLQLKGSLNNDLAKARERLHKRYQLSSKRQKEMTTDDLYSIFLSAFSTALDPHSDYMAAEQLEEFRIQTRLSLEGIGAVLSSEDGFTTIKSLVPGGAAAKTGKIKVEDKIIAVAQGADLPVDVIDMDLREVVKLIRGARGTEVRLTVVREEQGKTGQHIVPIKREQIQLEDKAAKSKVYPVSVEEKPARQYKIGVIELPSFYMDFEGRQNREKDFRSSSADVVREIGNLKKENVDAIIVDLRSNGGGSLDESIKIAGLFFDQGPVVQIKDMRGAIYVQSDEDSRTFYAGPLLVMVNRQSASASEIFAGAIQDYERGLIVGDTHTFGKGTVQNLQDIDEKLGAIKVTISKFYRPSGSSTQLKGVESDIVMPDIMDELEIGERFHDYALPWEKIKSSSFKNFAQVAPYVQPLRDASKTRIAKDPGFEKILTAVKEFRENESKRSRVSLKDEDSKEKEKEKEKEKDKKNKNKDPEMLEEDDSKLSITDDYHLQETLRIAADYVQLLNKRPLAAVKLPTVDKASVTAQKAPPAGAAKVPGAAAAPAAAKP